jgi:gluconokinase
MADIFEEEIIVPSNANSACLGAAFLGMKALGLITDLSSVDEMITIRARQKPVAEHVEIYREYKSVFNHLVKSLKADFSTLSEINRKLDSSL